MDIPAFLPHERTVPAMLRLQAARHGGRHLLACDETTWSFEEMRASAARHAAALAGAGIEPGDRVALLSRNRPEFLPYFLGIAWLGAVVVPINAAAKGPQLRYYLENSGARLLVAERELLEGVGEGVLAGVPVRPIDEPLAAGAEELPPAAVSPADTLAILYTSGTTGPSKGVRWPQTQLYWRGRISVEMLGIGQDDVLYTTLPLFHSNALNTFHQALLTGASMILGRRFSASAYWQEVVAHGATVIYPLGAMVPILLAREPSPDERRHRARVALAPAVPADLHREFQRRTGVAIINGYGSTETNFVIGSRVGEERPGYMGRVIPGFQAKVTEAGELAIRADDPLTVADGYYGMPEKTAEAWRDGWFHTGDRVVIEADGYIRFVDRMKDAIRRRGENISSYEVEQVLLAHPAVESAAVFPVPSELAEDEVMAALVLRPGARLSAGELIEHCAPQLAAFAVPRYVEFVDELPKTESGKVQKFRLRERGVTPATWDREKAHPSRQLSGRR